MTHRISNAQQRPLSSYGATILRLLFKVRNAGCKGSERTLIAVEQLALEDGYEWEEQ